MKFIFSIVFFTLLSCSSNKILPKNVKEISSQESTKCEFIDDLNIHEENISQHKLKQQIQEFSAARRANAYVISESVRNGPKVVITGSLFHCSK